MYAAALVVCPLKWGGDAEPCMKGSSSWSAAFKLYCLSLKMTTGDFVQTFKYKCFYAVFCIYLPTYLPTLNLSMQLLKTPDFQLREKCCLRRCLYDLFPVKYLAQFSHMCVTFTPHWVNCITRTKPKEHLVTTVMAQHLNLWRLKASRDGPLLMPLRRYKSRLEWLFLPPACWRALLQQLRSFLWGLQAAMSIFYFLFFFSYFQRCILWFAACSIIQWC